jgi:hypothetical protein
LSAEIKDEIEMEYGWLKIANLLWKVLEQMYGSSNSKKSSPSASEIISSSSTLFDQSLRRVVKFLKRRSKIC